MYNEAKTAACIDSEGWLHTGDIGKQDEGGFFTITGRIKEMIITAGGENMAPVLIEDICKLEMLALRVECKNTQPYTQAAYARAPRVR